MRLQHDSQCAKILRTLQDAASSGSDAVSMPALVLISGSYNIHSRIDELRSVHGWTQIENQTDLSVKPHKSVYWLPADNWQQPAAASQREAAHQEVAVA